MKFENKNSNYEKFKFVSNATLDRSRFILLFGDLLLDLLLSDSDRSLLLDLFSSLELLSRLFDPELFLRSGDSEGDLLDRLLDDFLGVSDLDLDRSEDDDLLRRRGIAC